MSQRWSVSLAMDSLNIYKNSAVEYEKLRLVGKIGFKI